MVSRVVGMFTCSQAGFSVRPYRLSGPRQNSHAGSPRCIMSVALVHLRLATAYARSRASSFWYTILEGSLRVEYGATMGNDDMLTDDYVADLLAKEASDCSLKYSALGMDAFRSDKK